MPVGVETGTCTDALCLEHLCVMFRKAMVILQQHAEMSNPLRVFGRRGRTFDGTFHRWMEWDGDVRFRG